MSIQSGADSRSNWILAALSEEEYRHVRTHGEEVQCPPGYVFYEAKEPISNVYFMLDGLASIVTPMEEGETVEVLLVGREGMVGLPTLDSENRGVPTRAFCQMRGRAIKFNAEVVRDEFNKGDSLHRAVMRYFQFALVQISQHAACNRMHDLEARLARWLLTVADRQNSNTFRLTHDLLAQMLGTRRSSVTLAAGVLQRAGLIQHHRGQIELINLEELQTAACECYEHIRESWDNLRRSLEK